MSAQPESNPHTEVSVYKPFRAGLPNLSQYFRQMWQRRELAIELSRSELRAQQATSVLGQFWLILNPLFLAVVYYVLVVILSGNKNHGPEFFAHMIAGLFIYHFIVQSITQGASSVVSVGKLITNRSFPRLLLPISAVLVAFRRFLPTMVVYFIFHVATGQPWSLTQLLAIPALLLIFLFCIGVAALFATTQVYFRDTKSFLPYFTRILMYISPVLFYPEALLHKLTILKFANPIFALLNVWGDSLVRQQTVSLQVWLAAIAWTLIVLVGGLFTFLTREREFAVRI